MNLNFNKLISFFLPFLTIYVISFVISKIIYIQLPKHSVESTKNSSNLYEYRKYDYINSFKVNTPTKKKTESEKSLKADYILNENIILQAIYQLSEDDGFVILQERGQSKTHTISKNEVFKGYKLISIKSNFILFEKDDKIFKLFMENRKDNNKSVATNIQNRQVNDEKPKIIKNDDNYIVQKQDIQNYTKDLKKIWNDIGLKTEKKNGKKIGFKVYKLKKNSVFTDLGLKKGDIMTEANGIKLDNYQNAFKLYNDINTIEQLRIKILRDNTEMELEYEIQ